MKSRDGRCNIARTKFVNRRAPFVLLAVDVLVAVRRPLLSCLSSVPPCRLLCRLISYIHFHLVHELPLLVIFFVLSFFSFVLLLVLLRLLHPLHNFLYTCCELPRQWPAATSSPCLPMSLHPLRIVPGTMSGSSSLCQANTMDFFTSRTIVGNNNSHSRILITNTLYLLVSPVRPQCSVAM